MSRAGWISRSRALSQKLVSQVGLKVKWRGTFTYVLWANQDLSQKGRLNRSTGHQIVWNNPAAATLVLGYSNPTYVVYQILKPRTIRSLQSIEQVGPELGTKRNKYFFYIESKNSRKLPSNETNATKQMSQNGSQTSNQMAEEMMYEKCPSSTKDRYQYESVVE